MAQPVEIFGDIKGMTRDFPVDSLPAGYLWNLVDAIPSRKGTKIDLRGGWVYHGPGSDYSGTIWGGYYSAFVKGQRLLLVANGQILDVNISTGGASFIGTGHPTMLQNGVKLRDRVYFMDGAGLNSPKVVTWTGASLSVGAITSPKGKVGIAYRDRLVLAGDPANPGEVYFSPLEIDGGPPSTWDALSHIGSSNEVTGLAAMPSQILVFHPAAIERIRGTVPPGTDLDTDMYVETLTDQVGCVQPQTIVPWRENIIFADERGVFLTDGSTVRNLTEMGGMGDFWRQAYGYRIANAPSVSCGTFLDYLLVNLNCLVGSTFASYTLICDLSTRAWFRFRNFPATCFIPSESATEESYCGNYLTNKLMRVSPMFQDAITTGPTPDYVDGNGNSVFMRVATGFKKLSKEEGLKRIRNVFVSYRHESAVRSPTANGVTVEYLIDPPSPEDNDPITGDPTGWVSAGVLPDASVYTRKKLPIGKAGYGVMVRIQGISSTRTSQLFSIGIETTSQDRGKVTT